MKFKSFILTLLILSFFSCGNDDNIDAYNPCDNESLGIEGVTISNFSIQPFNEGDEKGYLITGIITNDNSESVSGNTNFVFRENGRIITYGNGNAASSTTCLDIEAESTCDFEWRKTLYDNETLDNNIEFLCFYYSL